VAIHQVEAVSQETIVGDIRQSSRRVVREMGILNAPYLYQGVSASQGHALLELGSAGPFTVADLADRLRLDKSNGSRVVAELRRRKLVTVQAGDDRRTKVAALTPRGRQVVDRIDEIADRRVADALAQLGDEERGIVARGMALYAAALTIARR